MANEKLFKLRLPMHWTNSYVGVYPDVYVMAENIVMAEKIEEAKIEEAKKKVYANYKEENKKIAGIIMEQEVENPFIS